jgi:acyl-coenzyme A thioesterase PaaI-like protein
MATETTPLGTLADSILYLSSMLGAGARRIDMYIDYFGGGTPVPVRAPARVLRRRDRRQRLGPSVLRLPRWGA